MADTAHLVLAGIDVSFALQEEDEGQEHSGTSVRFGAASSSPPNRYVAVLGGSGSSDENRIWKLVDPNNRRRVVIIQSFVVMDTGMQVCREISMECAGS